MKVPCKFGEASWSSFPTESLNVENLAVPVAAWSTLNQSILQLLPMDTIIAIEVCFHNQLFTSVVHKIIVLLKVNTKFAKNIWERVIENIIKRPARDACLCMGELQAPPAPAAPHFVFLITL